MLTAMAAPGRVTRGAKGEKGDDGAAGAVGPAGPKGDKGDKGDTGDAGPAGNDGADGADGADGDPQFTTNVTTTINSTPKTLGPGRQRPMRSTLNAGHMRGLR